MICNHYQQKQGSMLLWWDHSSSFQGSSSANTSKTHGNSRTNSTKHQHHCSSPGLSLCSQQSSGGLSLVLTMLIKFNWMPQVAHQSPVWSWGPVRPHCLCFGSTTEWFAALWKWLSQNCSQDSRLMTFMFCLFFSILVYKKLLSYLETNCKSFGFSSKCQSSKPEFTSCWCSEPQDKMGCKSEEPLLASHRVFLWLLENTSCLRHVDALPSCFYSHQECILLYSQSCTSGFSVKVPVWGFAGRAAISSGTFIVSQGHIPPKCELTLEY